MKSQNPQPHHGSGVSGAYDGVGSQRQSRSNVVFPRLMNASEAARYLGHQSRAVLKSIPVAPIQLTADGVGRGRLYDRYAIDLWLDEVSGIRHPTASKASDTEERNAQFDHWRRAREARHD
jgi:hypothetical protein